MSKIFTPVNQTRLTNIAIVRMKKAGKRFEIACYKNKVMSWRNKTEKNIDEVLQTHSVFTNVSKGQMAKNADLEKAFKTTDQTEICKIILDKGQLQVAEKERAQQLGQMTNQIATLVAEMSVNSDTMRPYSIQAIEGAIKQEINFSVNVNRSAKQQALLVIKKLQEKIPICRAQMRLRFLIPSGANKDSKKIREKILPLVTSVEKEDFIGGLDMTCLVDPGNYKKLEEVVAKESRGSGSVDVLNLKEVDDQGDTLAFD